MNRLREAREYVGLTRDEAAQAMGCVTCWIDLIEADLAPLTDADWEWAAKLYQRPVAWLKGEPAPPVAISPELDRLMERLSDHDRSAVVAFAEFLSHRGEQSSADPTPNPIGARHGSG